MTKKFHNELGATSRKYDKITKQME